MCNNTRDFTEQNDPCHPDKNTKLPLVPISQMMGNAKTEIKNIIRRNNSYMSKCGKLSTSHQNISQKHLRRLVVTYRVHRREPLRKRGGVSELHIQSSTAVLQSFAEIQRLKPNIILPISQLR